ncbi:MAG: TonB family protein [Prevotella shahii]|uniref:Protein TonB n=1 Tax=Hoylesella shahii DSM 15611 = JCM 12083 TaxID=1122991 RepID=A0A318I0R6_9BACT|nr:energy transducer TonB [Hoylesella shahii]MBF1590988.1 TonB family protein [Hoylesella shahii]PXX24172.1 protein TonB [Hoylesella shahii DSM 15611 = JCM 12083]
MEIKKTHSANLENKRVTNYLLGLVVVLSFLFVGLEYNSQSRTFNLDDELPDDIFEEMEVLPEVEKNEMVSAAKPTAAPSITTKIKAVDTPVTLPEKVNMRNEEEEEGNEATRQQNETPTTAIEQPVPEPIADDNKPRIVQQMPEYPGGIVEFMKWLQRTLRYPPTAQQQGIQGSVMVSFIVNVDGTITEQKVVRGVNEELDAEALRVISNMPKWKPGLDKGKPCRTLFAIPIVFKL